jgi:hypothetical protein
LLPEDQGEGKPQCGKDSSNAIHAVKRIHPFAAQNFAWSVSRRFRGSTGWK